MNETTFKGTPMLQLHIPWVSLIKVLNFRGEAEETHMSKLSEAKQEDA